ncbi:MAG: sigma-70 family RNA polymerase sigma factor [Gemmataceae bacterium]|nr:sigma-70 family RNA polymerase sigma factor [Gemmataceae bacterium]
MSDGRSNGSGDGASACTSRGLLDRARGHDPAAWERLVSLYAPLVFHWCRRWGLRDDDAADVFQEVFQAVAARLGGFRRDPAGGTFRGWLRTIARNKVNDLFRRRRHEFPGAGGSEAQARLLQVPGPVPPDDAPPDAGVPALLRRALELIRGEFEPRTWQAFWRTAVDGRSPKDVADELGMSGGAVRVAKSRVLHRLREVLGDRGSLASS